MICYIPFGSTWQYYLGEGYNTHPVYTYEGGVIRMFDMPTDEMFPWTSKGWDSEWKRNSRADFSQAIYYYRGNSSGDNLNHITKLSHVTRLTEVLGKVQAADPAVFTAGKKEQLVGEVALCRAMLMYFIYHVYGPMPVIVNPDDVENEEVQKNRVREKPRLHSCRGIRGDQGGQCSGAEWNKTYTVILQMLYEGEEETKKIPVICEGALGAHYTINEDNSFNFTDWTTDIGVELQNGVPTLIQAQFLGNGAWGGCFNFYIRPAGTGANYKLYIDGLQIGYDD